MEIRGYKIEPHANLKGADLWGANLWGADLWGADLRGANLWGADLWGADLRGANLWGANLWGADLRGANLSDAKLIDANLKGANLRCANLSDAVLPDFQICPQEGSFIAFKRVSRGVIKILIPAEAKRTSSLVGRKCRAEFVQVLEGRGQSRYDHDYDYREGETVYPDEYDDDIRVECTNGIHFFMTRKEAEEY